MKFILCIHVLALTYSFFDRIRTLVAIATLYFYCLIMVKWKLPFIAVLLQTVLQKFYRKVPGVIFYQPCEFCPNY